MCPIMKTGSMLLAFSLLLCLPAACCKGQPLTAPNSTSLPARPRPAVAAQPATDAVIISDLLDLRTTCGAGSSDEGVHGGTQSRICHTSHGAYAAYLGRDKSGGAIFHLVRVQEGKSTLLYTAPTTVAGSNGVHVLCDADEEIYVLTGGAVSVHGKERASLGVYHFDHKTGVVTDHREDIPFNHGVSYGYSSACIDPAHNRIHAVYSGGDAPGYFAWFTFDLMAKTWVPHATVIDLKYRHCYNYCFTDGMGGMVILSERDIKNATAGITPSDTNRKINAEYVWDELRLFHIGDLASRAYTTVNVEKAVYDKKAGLYPNVQNNYRGDAYIDARGNLHVLYMSDDNNGIPGTFLRHALYDARHACLCNERLALQGEYALRMTQSTSGTHYIIAMPYKQTARVQLWRATDTEGLHYKLFGEKQFHTNAVPTYAGLAVSCPRNGSLRDDVIDCLFPVGHDYHYFSIALQHDRTRP